MSEHNLTTKGTNIDYSLLVSEFLVKTTDKKIVE